MNIKTAGHCGYLPAPYMTASMMEDIHDTSLLVAWNISSISLKNTVIDLANAYEKPMEMKAPNTTAHPQPPSGGVYPTGPPTAGGILRADEFPKAVQIEYLKDIKLKQYVSYVSNIALPPTLPTINTSTLYTKLSNNGIAFQCYLSNDIIFSGFITKSLRAMALQACVSLCLAGQCLENLCSSKDIICLILLAKISHRESPAKYKLTI